MPRMKHVNFHIYSTLQGANFSLQFTGKNKLITKNLGYKSPW